MGLSNMKFYFKSNTIMIDKANFTSNISLESTNFVKNISNSILPKNKSTLKDTYNEKFISLVVDQVTSNGDAINLQTKKQEIDLKEKALIKNGVTDDFPSKNIQTTHCLYPIDKLGLHEVSCKSNTTCYSGIIYLPECYTVLSHYITLYKFKLDSLCQLDFKKICTSLGHYSSSNKYNEMKQVYKEMKSNHFQESFIINKIISKQNVQLRISDCFGHETKPLRALIVIGKRFSTVKNVVECYCFNIKGKVPFIIKSSEDYKNVIKSFERNGILEIKSNGFCLNKSKSLSILSRGKLSQQVKNSKDNQKNLSNKVEVLTIQPNCINEIRSLENHLSDSGLLYEPLENYMRYQRYHTDINSICYNSSVFYNGFTYNLVSVITDKTHAYIICKNGKSNLNSINEKEFQTKIIDQSPANLNANQSNSFSHLESLQNIMKIEICEAFVEKYYGVSLRKVPCGQFYVVQCVIEGQIANQERLFNEILSRHIIFGKVINKEYNIDLQNHYNINLIMHLHGNENNILNCSNELKIEGLARNFKLIHPQTGKICQQFSKTVNELFSKMNDNCQDGWKNLSILN